jgi:hypothetical protein
MITPVYVTAGANSDANGNITFTFPAVPTDVWLVTLSVPDGLTGSFTAVSAGVTYGQWQGVNGTGPLWIPGPGSITITGSNLTPSSPFMAVAQGSAGTMADIPPQAPTPTASSVQATRTQQFIQTVTAGSLGTANTIVQLSPNWRSLYVGPAGPLGSTYGELLSVVGQQSGLDYNFYVPSFSPGTTGGPEFTRIPLWAGVDTTVALQLSGYTPGATVYIGADNDPSDIALDTNTNNPVYTVTTRYDGYPVPIGQNVATANSAAASGTLVASPGVGFGLLLVGIYIATGTGVTGFASVAGTFSAASTVIAQANSISGTQIGTDRALWPNGLLCDSATAVTFAATPTGTTRYIAYYDIVPSSASLRPR